MLGTSGYVDEKNTKRYQVKGQTHRSDVGMRSLILGQGGKTENIPSASDSSQIFVMTN